MIARTALSALTLMAALSLAAADVTTGEMNAPAEQLAWMGPAPRPAIATADSPAPETPSTALPTVPVPRPNAPATAPRPVSGPDQDAHVTDRIEALRGPKPRRRVPASCSPDGVHCIAPVAFTRDVCRTIEAVASANGLDPGFFARLIWRESLFDPYAISPAGALGIAQFMPSTARLRGLDDPFNPAAALQASGQYLSELSSRFGNLGLAAVAYNGGEARVARFLSRSAGLPTETRDYVSAITGYRAETWRDAPPETTDFSLAPELSFEDACQAKAVSRNMRELRAPGESEPWLLIFAAHPDRTIAERRGDWLRSRFPGILGEADPGVVESSLPGKSQPFFVARMGQPTESAARSLCNRLRVAGGGCMVLRN